MKSYINYLNFKITSNKIFPIFIILILYQFYFFYKLVNQNLDYTFYDLIIKQFNYLTLFYFFTLFFLISIYNIFNNDNFYKYVYTRFKNKIQVFNANVFTLFCFSIMFVIFIDLIAFLESIGKISFRNEWSSYFYETMNGSINLFYTQSNLLKITSKITPIEYIVYINIFIILYFLCIGLIFLVSNIFFKNKSFSLILILLIIGINTSIDSIKGILSKISFTNNIFFITSTSIEIASDNYILIRLLYWCILIIIIYFFGIFLTYKIDYKFHD